jgi:multicomponent Na+:H+ antiporter subunit B
VNRSRRRLLFFAPVCVGLAAVLVWGLGDLPAFGIRHSAYAQYFLQHASRQRHSTNVVAAIVFDYRGWDTLGEELIMVSGVMGTALLLRSSREEGRRSAQDAVTSDLLGWLRPVAVAVVLIVGLWLVSYGYITPGGGFQGGVVAASAALMTWLVGSYRTHRRLTPEPLMDGAEGIAAFGYLAIGLAGLAAGSNYLYNVLPLGITGDLPSSGTIALLNAATGLAVAAGVVLIFREFLEDYAAGLPEESR